MLTSALLNIIFFLFSFYHFFFRPSTNKYNAYFDVKKLVEKLKKRQMRAESRKKTKQKQKKKLT